MPLPRAAAADLQGDAELALEYDSNPGRVERLQGIENPKVSPSMALRGLLGVRALWAPGDRTRLLLWGRGGGRAFADPDAEADNVGLAQAQGQAIHAMDKGKTVTLGFSYYESFQQRGNGARDFRSLTPSFRFDKRGDLGTWSVGTGYRWFDYKPFADFDFSGPNAFLRWNTLWFSGDAAEEEDNAEDFEDDLDTFVPAAQWDLSLFLSGERRLFAGDLCLHLDTCTDTEKGTARADSFASLGAEVTRTADSVVGAGAAVQVNASNAEGFGLWRFVAHVQGAVPLPWLFTLSGRAEAFLSRYNNPLTLARDSITGMARISIEDESRNTVRAELMRPIARRWDMGLKYILFTNAFGSGPVSYTRHNLLVSVVYSTAADNFLDDEEQNTTP